MSGGPRATAAVLALAMGAALLGDMMLYTVLPAHPEAAGIGVGALGLVLSVHRFIRLGANPLGGLLLDRYGRRQPFLLGMALAAAATLGYLLAWGPSPLLAARLTWGLAYALLSVGSLSILLDLTTPANRGQTAGFYQALTNVATLAALLLSGVLADLVGYRGTLALFTGLTALGWLVAHRAVPETRPGRRRLFGRASAAGDAAMAAAAAGSVGSAILSLVGAYGRLDRQLLAPGYVSLVSFFAGNGVLMATLGMHLKSQLPSDGAGGLVPLASLTGLLLGARKLGIMAAAPVAGRLADLAPDRRWVAAGGVLISLAGFAILAWGRGMALVVTGVIVTALGEGTLMPTLTAWAGDLAPSDLRGVAMGGLATANDLGGALGPLVGYAVGAAFGFESAYGLCAVFLVSALAVVFVAGSHPRRR